jgi:broad specificity phosphatase PhoE
MTSEKLTSEKLKTIFLFRHGETDWNREGRMQGSVDIPLNQTGREQAARLHAFFKDNPVDVVLSSDLSRARETAEIAVSALDIPIVLEPRLRETKLGDAEGLTPDEFAKRFGEELLARWRDSGESGMNVRFPNGESKAEHLARVIEGLSDFLHSTPHSRIAVATHGGAMRRIIHHILPDLEHAVMVGNCVVYRLIYNTQNKIWEINSDPVCGDPNEIARARGQLSGKKGPRFST